MKGRFYANVFIHFEPAGHTLRHEESMLSPDEQARYAKAREMKKTTKKNEDDLPHYITRGTPEEKRWRQQNSNKKEVGNNIFKIHFSLQL